MVSYFSWHSGVIAKNGIWGKWWYKFSNNEVTLCQGDIAKLKIDAIVNSANKSLIDRGGIDESIHGAVQPGMLDECQKLNGC